MHIYVIFIAFDLFINMQYKLQKNCENRKKIEIFSRKFAFIYYIRQKLLK